MSVYKDNTERNSTERGKEWGLMLDLCNTKSNLDTCVTVINIVCLCALPVLTITSECTCACTCPTLYCHDNIGGLVEEASTFVCVCVCVCVSYACVCMCVCVYVCV